MIKGDIVHKMSTYYDDDISISYEEKRSRCADLEINEFTSVPYSVLLKADELKELINILQKVFDYMTEHPYQEK